MINSGRTASTTSRTSRGPRTKASCGLPGIVACHTIEPSDSGVTVRRGWLSVFFLLGPADEPTGHLCRFRVFDSPAFLVRTRPRSTPCFSPIKRTGEKRAFSTCPGHPGPNASGVAGVESSKPALSTWKLIHILGFNNELHHYLRSREGCDFHLNPASLIHWQSCSPRRSMRRFFRPSCRIVTQSRWA